MKKTSLLSAIQSAPAAGKPLAPVRVAIQGIEGAFHHVAARECFSSGEVVVVPCHTFDEVVRVVEQGEAARLGLMAIENTLAGSILPNYNLLHSSRLQICGEVYLHVEQHVMGIPGTKLEELREVSSHPMALAQCKPFFEGYPNIKLKASEDTALSAMEVSMQKNGLQGAIASELAAELYGLEVLARGVETDKQNYTRFLLLCPSDLAKDEGERNKVSLCFDVMHEVGCLHQVLSVLSAYGANLTKIQSAPIVGHPWEYRFFIDFLVKEGGLPVEKVLEAIRPLVNDLHILGQYEQGKFVRHESN
jgi:prephenate dehydratase